MLKPTVTVTHEHLEIAKTTVDTENICTTCVMAVAIAMENNLPIGSISCGYGTLTDKNDKVEDPEKHLEYSSEGRIYTAEGMGKIVSVFDSANYTELYSMLPATVKINPR